jgi:integrase
MALKLNRLGVRQVQSIKAPGRHADGGGLYLVVTKSGAKKWAFLYRRRRDGKLSEMGLGGVSSVPLVKAREKAAEARKLLAEGKDPLKQRRDRQDEAGRVPTFGEFSDKLIQSLEGGFRSEKTKASWRMTMQVYAAPIRARVVDEITTADVLDILQPIWIERAETASRVRARIEKILDAAKAKGHRSGENPARWRGHLDHLLPKQPPLQRGHHPAMPWLDVPAFVKRLRKSQSVGALALEFVILTAARSGEVLRSVREGELTGARWEEIDLETRVWTLPPKRMKSGKEHRVPLSGRAIEILCELCKAKRGPFIFPGQRGDTPLSEMALELIMRRMEAKPFTVHGFRSSFRDWVWECTVFPRELAEVALAHTVGDAVERAYRRGDALEKRRELMEAWAKFLHPDVQSKIVPLASANRR